MTLKLRIQSLTNYFKKNPFASLNVIVGIVVVISYVIVALVNDSIWTMNSDDAVQYFVFEQSVFNSIKNGTFSFFDMNLGQGTSVFALEYYVPIDIFSLLKFLLSFIMPYNRSS